MAEQFRPRSRRRRWIVCGVTALAALATAAVSVRAAVAEVFVVPTDVVAPEVPKGAHILVYKLGSTFEPGQIIAFRDGDRVLLGRVAGVRPDGTVEVARNGPAAGPLGAKDIVGRVVLTSR